MPFSDSFNKKNEYIYMYSLSRVSVVGFDMIKLIYHIL